MNAPFSERLVRRVVEPTNVRLPGAREPAPIVGWILPALFLLAWQLASSFGALPSNWLPAPSIVVQVVCVLGNDELARTRLGNQ